VTSFIDGPAAGITLALRRAPTFLRVVRDAHGVWDALDQLADAPAEGDEVLAYQRCGEAGSIHIDGTDKRGRRVGTWFAFAQYKYAEPRPDRAVMVSTEAWRAWATAAAAGRPGSKTWGR
jgi:hypothetical protein